MAVEANIFLTFPKINLVRKGLTDLGTWMPWNYNEETCTRVPVVFFYWNFKTYPCSWIFQEHGINHIDKANVRQPQALRYSLHLYGYKVWLEVIYKNNVISLVFIPKSSFEQKPFDGLWARDFLTFADGLLWVGCGAAVILILCMLNLEKICSSLMYRYW